MFHLYPIHFCHCPYLVRLPQIYSMENTSIGKHETVREAAGKTIPLRLSNVIVMSNDCDTRLFMKVHSSNISTLIGQKLARDLLPPISMFSLNAIYTRSTESCGPFISRRSLNLLELLKAHEQAFSWNVSKCAKNCISARVPFVRILNWTATLVWETFY